jgi:hypothetical protein
MNPTSLLEKTGEMPVLSPPSKTKNNAVPAGLSLLLLLWKVLTSKRTANSRASLNNNSLTAPSHSVTTAAKVV